MPNDDEPPIDPHENPDDDQALQGEIRHHQVSARVPPEIGPGVFSNGVMILTGPYEIVLDYVMRLGEQQRIAARVVLPHVVGRQFAAALQDNIANYERRFGPMPEVPRPLPEIPDEDVPAELPIQSPPREGGGSADSNPVRQRMDSSAPPEIDEIYNELKIPDSMLSGRYANAVLIRHSATEFCFDFITNVYPRSAVSARVFLATPHVAPFLKSLILSLNPPNPPSQFPPPVV
ncbi:MAG TPA: DUF3467 domain-containing protein [Planctomicrobium sp.]|nr:DUF3467 domain-containing protein [Planctomicrobium sp.]